MNVDYITHNRTWVKDRLLFYLTFTRIIKKVLYIFVCTLVLGGGWGVLQISRHGDAFAMNSFFKVKIKFRLNWFSPRLILHYRVRVNYLMSGTYSAAAYTPRTTCSCKLKKGLPFNLKTATIFTHNIFCVPEVTGWRQQACFRETVPQSINFAIYPWVMKTLWKV